MAYHNPATQRRNGATNNFFVTASLRPAGLPARPRRRGHRHTSVAINYHFSGSGASVVNGQEIAWEAGDLLLSAPGWLEHAHYVGPDGLGVFTVQDHPLQIGLEALVWQEDLDGPVLALAIPPAGCSLPVSTKRQSELMRQTAADTVACELDAVVARSGHFDAVSDLSCFAVLGVLPGPQVVATRRGWPGP
jgi:hypothetical protein